MNLNVWNFIKQSWVSFLSFAFWTTIPVPSISLHKAPFQLPTQAHIIIHIHTHYWLPTHMYMSMCVL